MKQVTKSHLISKKNLTAEKTQHLTATVLQQDAAKEQGCKCMWMPTVETRRAVKTTRNAGGSVSKCQERTATFMTLEFKPCKRCNDWRKLLLERSNIAALRYLFLKAMYEIKQSIYDIVRTIIDSILLYNFSRKSCAPPPHEVAPHTLEGTYLHFVQRIYYNPFRIN